MAMSAAGDPNYLVLERRPSSALWELPYGLEMISSGAAASAEFPVVRWRPGYEIDEVRAALLSVSETLGAYEAGRTLPDMVTAGQLKRTRFQPTKFRDGWEQVFVDRFLRDLRDTLVAYERRTSL